MKKLLYLVFAIFVVVLSSCKNSNRIAEQTVKDFASAIKNPKSNIDSIYWTYSSWDMPEWAMRTTIEDLSCADSIKIIDTKQVYHGDNKDTCEVLCKNYVKNDEATIEYNVKFLVVVSNGRGRIITSYGLVQLNPTYKKILMDAGAIDNDMEDRTYAACWEDYNRFIEYSKIIRGNDLTKVQFHKNDYEDFLQGWADFQNKQLMEGKPTPEQNVRMALRYKFNK